MSDQEISLKNSKIAWWVSWPVIIIACVLFWPVGIFLIWRRTIIDKRAALGVGKIIKIAGWLSIALALIGFMVCLSEGFGSDDVSGIIFFILAGGALIFLGKKISDGAQKVKKYINIVVNQEVTNIDRIAECMPTTYEDAKKYLEQMIDRGYFENAYINESTREIVLKQKEIKEVDFTMESKAQNEKLIMVMCKGCGANNTIIEGSVGECEFCGSSIE